MKKITFLISVFLWSALFSQEKKISSEVSSATVFLNSAQVTRSKKVELNKGVQFLKFVNLSPFIDKKSIQIKAADVEIQAVNFQKNYLEKSKASQEQKKLENNIIDLEQAIDIENVSLSVIQEEIQFLKKNGTIGGKNQILTVAVLKETSRFYSTRIKELKISELKSKKKIKKLVIEKDKIVKQLGHLTSKKDFASGEIVVKVKSSYIKSVVFELNYNVSNVSWYPSYDVRVQDINSPLKLVYKANLKQNSKIDWNNVKLRFSSANPNYSTKASKIKPYFMDYGTVPPLYGSSIDEVTGYVSSKEGALPGVSVFVKGTSIATTTDFDGKYSIKVPENSESLIFSYLGYKKATRFIVSSVINVVMLEDQTILDEVVVASYGASDKKYKPRSLIQGKANGINADSAYYTPIPTKDIVNQTSVSFEITEPYTIKSSNKDFVISMKTYQSKAEYNYYTVPRIEEKAFLVASLDDWEKLNLLEGEANIYFENTFIGTSLIDTRTTTNKLDISLGMDKNISVKRTKGKDFTTRQFIGNKQEETSVWNFIVKNNKAQDIRITLLDQIPISKREEIKVTLDKLFSGKLTKDSGEVKWNLTLSPSESEELQLKYVVRYPKGRHLIID